MTQYVKREFRGAGTTLYGGRAELRGGVDARAFGSIIAAAALAVSLVAMISESRLTSDQHVANFESSHTLP
jgi:hypothetical protein